MKTTKEGILLTKKEYWLVTVVIILLFVAFCIALFS